MKRIIVAVAVLMVGWNAEGGKYIEVECRKVQ